MDVMMSDSMITLRGFAAALALALVAGCAAQGPAPQQAAAAPQHDAATSGPQLAGVWYQVYFDTNSSVVNPRGQMIARTVAYVVQHDTATRVTVIGKTDRVGAAPANLTLSRQRAKAVRDALVTAGVPADHIDTSWTGEGTQAVATANGVNQAYNRVVDVTVVKTSP